MSDVEAIFSDLLDQQPSAAALSEANDKTIPGGTYKFEIVKSSFETGSEKSPWPDRPLVRVTVQALYKNGDGNYKSRGRINFDMSPEERREIRNNRLDGPSRLWMNLISVVGEGATHRDALQYLSSGFPLTGTVTKTYKNIDGKWITIKTDEDLKKMHDEGGEPRNFVQGLRAFSG